MKVKFEKQILLSPVVDLSMGLNAYAQAEKEDALLGQELVKWTCERYIPAGHDPKDPAMSPYWEEDVSHLPATHIIVAEHDRFRSQAHAWHDKLTLAGVQSSIEVCLGQVHSFLTLRGALNEGVNPIELVVKLC